MLTCDRCKCEIPKHIFVFEINVTAIDHTGYEAPVRNNKFCPDCYKKVLDEMRVFK